MKLKKVELNRMTLKTKTIATLPNVIGRMKKLICLPNFESKEIFDKKMARQNPIVTLRIAESKAKENVLSKDGVKPFELSEKS